MPKLTEIPKKEALGYIDDVIVEELEGLIKTLNFEVTKLKGIKKELSKLK